MHLEKTKPGEGELCGQLPVNELQRYRQLQASKSHFLAVFFVSTLNPACEVSLNLRKLFPVPPTVNTVFSCGFTLGAGKVAP